MRSIAWSSGLMIGFFMMDSSGLAADRFAAAFEQEPRIVVTVYNYAQVSGGILANAEAVATRILHRAGIGTSWQEHTATAAGSETVASAVRTRIEVHITMHIVPRSMAVRLAPNHICLGLSVVPLGNKRGDMAYVFYHRVEELARRRSLSAGDSLGHAMAHEIGHLLLGVQSHSPAGLMRARWDRSDLLRAATGWLSFTDREAARLRANLRARTESASTGRAGACP